MTKSDVRCVPGALHACVGVRGAIPGRVANDVMPTLLLSERIWRTQTM